MTKKSDWKPTRETLDELDREAASLLSKPERKRSKPKKSTNTEVHSWQWVEESGSDQERQQRLIQRGLEMQRAEHPESAEFWNWRLAESNKGTSGN